MSEMTVTELEQLIRPSSEIEEDREAMKLCDQLERMDRERMADRVEAVLAPWKGPDGYPLPGFESPRFVDARKADYYDWLMSEDGERTRRNVHPRLEER